MNIVHNSLVWFAVMGLLAVGVPAQEAVTGSGQSFAYLVIDSNEVHLGVPFDAVLLVEAGKGVVKADFSDMRDFSTRYVSSRTGSSPRGARYELHYAFVARKSGKLTIPAMQLAVGNETLQTQPVDLTVRAPERSDALGLEISLSREQCYVGEPIELSVIWRVDKELSLVSAVDLHIPILDDPRFEAYDPAQAIDAASKGATGLPVGSKRVIANRATQKRGNGESNTLTFTKVVVPRQTGVIEIGRGSVYCAVTTSTKGNTQSVDQYPSYFDNDFFKRDIEGTYKRCFTRSEGLRLEVKPLPEAGCPAGFYGLVSAALEIRVQAAPLQVAGGTPLSLEVRMHAKEFIENLTLQPLGDQTSLAAEFVIPRERAPFIYERHAKVFTQSLRPKRPDVTAIGAIAVPYFDTDLDAYAVVQSKPIAIEVLDTGTESITGSAHPNQGRTAKNRLILHLVGIAIVFFVGVSVGMTLFAGNVRKTYRTENRAPGLNAYPDFKRALASSEKEDNLHKAIYTALRNYLGATLGAPPHTLVCNDAIHRLQAQGVDPETLDTLARVFSECDVHRFGMCYTNDNAWNPATLKDLAMTCTQAIEANSIR